MTYSAFKAKVKALIRKAGGCMSVKFSIEDGRYIARFDDGIRIIGNSVAQNVRIEWGSGHRANAII